MSTFRFLMPLIVAISLSGCCGFAGGPWPYCGYGDHGGRNQPRDRPNDRGDRYPDHDRYHDHGNRYYGR